MLRVIGAGFGRTGTLSLKMALEQLGFGPCYHMAEVFAHPEHVALWRAIGDGHPADWAALFGGYQAAVDLPASEYYEQLMHAYPQAKVVLTVRDPEQWYESASSTIFRVGRDERPFELPPGFVEMVGAMMGRFFPRGVDDRAATIAAFERHNRQVQERVPPERLLVYEVREGWAPLCRFLGVGVSATPFPRLNDRVEFQGRTQPFGNGDQARLGRASHRPCRTEVRPLGATRHAPKTRLSSTVRVVARFLAEVVSASTQLGAGSTPTALEARLAE